MQDIHTIGVVGAGAWGTALAVLARRAGTDVTLWSRNPNVIEPIQQKRMNDAYLPNIYIDPTIQVTDRLQDLSRSDTLILAIPAQYLRSVCIMLSDLIDTDLPLVISTKGIERGSLALMSEVVSTILPSNPLAILSGPNFADEAAKGLPTATTLACQDKDLGERLLYAIGGKHFRPYLSDDLIGTQIGGAVKNVIAIACGIALGRGMGENARAALITRGLAEMTRLCLSKGGKPETLMGLSGIGDLLLTCSSDKSRNTSLGMEIGRSGNVDDIIPKQRRGVTEGIATAESVTQLAQKLGIAMPICFAVQQILYEHSSINDTIAQLLERPFTQETAHV